MHSTHTQRADYLLGCTGVNKRICTMCRSFCFSAGSFPLCPSGEDPPPQGRNTPPSASLTPPLHEEGEACKISGFLEPHLRPQAAQGRRPGEGARGPRCRCATPPPRRGVARGWRRRKAEGRAGCRRRPRAARRGGRPFFLKLLTVRAKATDGEMRSISGGHPAQRVGDCLFYNPSVAT